MKIKILQWNIWFKEKPENIIELIKEINPDIVCLQELRVGCEHNDFRNVPEVISKAIGFNYNYSLAHSFSKKENQGNAIFSRFPILKNSNFFIQHATEPITPSTEGRTCAVSELDLGKNKTITVATTHSSYHHKFIENANKINEIKTLLNGLKKYDSLILTGDLNAPPDKEGIKIIETHLLNLGPNYKEATWTTKPFNFNGFKETDLKWRLDYAFGTKNIKVTKSQIIETKYSDHLPILIEIEI